MVSLNDAHRKKIHYYINKFREYTKSEEYRKDIEEREEREQYFSGLSKQQLLSLNELEFGKIISNLWASRLWTNKEYLVQNIITKNKFDNLKNELAELLFSDTTTIEKRFDHALKTIKYLGPASITEMLCYKNPYSFGIWNDRARKALKILGFDDILPIAKYKINGKEYQNFNQTLLLIADELKKSGFNNVDLLFVDYYLYEVERTEDIGVTGIISVFDFDHDEVRDFIRDVGIWLGFETETEKTIGHGARVDAIWTAKIANLGVVNYVFEVHKKGSIDGLIVNLQKAKKNPTVQKIIAVSDSNQLDKIKQEIRGLPEEFIRAMAFWDVTDTMKTHEKLADVIDSIEKLELVKSEFEK